MATRPYLLARQGLVGNSQPATSPVAKPASGPTANIRRVSRSSRPNRAGDDSDSDFEASNLKPTPFRVISDIMPSLGERPRSTSHIPLPPIPGAPSLALTSGVQALQRNWASRQATTTSDNHNPTTATATDAARNGSIDLDLTDETTSPSASRLLDYNNKSASNKRPSAPNGDGQQQQGSVKRRAVGDAWTSLGEPDVSSGAKQGFLSEADLAKVIETGMCEGDGSMRATSSDQQRPRHTLRSVQRIPIPAQAQRMADEQSDIIYDDSGRVLYDSPNEQRNALNFDGDPTDSDSSMDEIPAQADKKKGANQPSYTMQSLILKGEDVKALALSRDGREYSMLPLDHGGLVKTNGGLIPDGYRQYPDPDTPFICPVRHCRKLFSTPVGLGGHFSSGHRARLFNDNGDGTLSDVGRYTRSEGRSPPVVLSQNPPHPNEPPMAVPWVPPTVSARPRLSGSASTNVFQVHTAAQNGRGEKTLGMDTKTYVSHILKENPKFRWEDVNHPQSHALLKLPRKRDLPQAWVVRWAHKRAIGKKAFVGLLAYLVGDESKDICSQCSGSEHPISCVVAGADFPLDIQVSLAGACTICQYRYMMWHQRNCCSIKQDTTVGATMAPSKSAEAEAEPEADLTMSGLQETQLMGWGDHNEAEVSISAAPHAGPTAASEPSDAHGSGKINGTRSRPNGVVRGLRSWHGPSQPDNDDNHDVLVVNPGQTMSAEALEMEDWEVAPGRIEDSGNDKDGMAYSYAYLTTNKAVPITQDVGMNVLVLKPGQQNRWDSDQNNLRFCWIAAGKLKIKVDNEREFQVGPHGMFKIKPGLSCVVTNRLYIDTVVHVTTVREL